MEAYLIRLKDGEPHAREIVGIFVADDMEQLYWMVDECAPPPDCECLALGPGGIYWDSFTGQRVPRDAEPDWETLPDDWSPLPPSPSLTDAWDNEFSAQRAIIDDAWEPVVWPGDEASPTVASLPKLPLPRHRRRRSRS